ncbi:hypothetical protein VOLCADRAFT_106473 [Volvox carteri f. nagariensis]|uniref:Uncharacterized protein n=1 Tax=Volvox carteri f. nagariensis TaxID=3068 RepID=D8U7M0_VOLCA|nr:uncharacterized protein VOLCADRAFT_106473 [Volvox carteri f. nagariensis]EFJ44324.1 hypothetical protein VOLCADRAFT_106473 [Volvox carteri f. nagariensis]|eukprot:XP_002954683.1 hypothetical protein VOLCADRAFT_106473 [Volvox carteri f. nagariensis]
MLRGGGGPALLPQPAKLVAHAVSAQSPTPLLIHVTAQTATKVYRPNPEVRLTGATPLDGSKMWAVEVGGHEFDHDRATHLQQREGLDQTMNGGENCVNLALVHKYPVNADEPPPLDQRVFSVISVNANKDGSIVYAAEAGGSSDQAVPGLICCQVRRVVGTQRRPMRVRGRGLAWLLAVVIKCWARGEHGRWNWRRWGLPPLVHQVVVVAKDETRSEHGGLTSRPMWPMPGSRRLQVAIGRSMPVPQYERLVRPLTRCEPGVARLAWERVLRYHNEEGRRMTAELVVSCIQEVGTASTVAQSDSEDESGMADVVAPVTAVSRANGHDEDAVPAGSRPIFLQSASVEWYTPQCILDKVAEMFGPGGIDLDPCSSEAANTRVKAGRFFDVALDGLSEACRWEGNVFVNPPFGSRGVLSMQNLFFERCVKEYRQGAVKQAVVLLKAAVGYKWFRAVLEWPVCFLWERLAFVQPQHTSVGEESELKWGSRVQNPHGSVVVYLGTNVDKFVRIFGDIGSIAGANAWAHQNSPR